MKSKELKEAEVKRINETDSIDELRALLQVAHKDRDEAEAAVHGVAGLWVEAKQNELYAAIKALEIISLKALDIADKAIQKGD